MIALADHLLFRSASYASGQTRRVGNVHLHVDVASAAGVIGDLVTVARRLDRAGWSTKVTRVERALGGAHLAHPDYSCDYALHTPELLGEVPTFTAYLTTQLSCGSESEAERDERVRGGRSSVEAEIARAGITNAVIEMEQVRLAFSDGSISGELTDGVHPFIHQPARFEVHHLIDAESDLSLAAFADHMASSGIVVGGWFEFANEAERAFRSVRFCAKPERDHLAEQHRLVRAAALRAPRMVVRRVDTTVEAILDIWRVEV